jgi:hypothetical protein
MRKRLFALSAGLFVLLMHRGVMALDVTSCGTTVPAGEVGELVADLDCTNGPGHCADDPAISCSSAGGGFVDCPNSGCITYGVHLAPSATLDMNGHTISGGDYGVLCRDFGCAVDGGGGTIANEEFSAIWLFGGGRLTVSHLTIHDTKRGSIVLAFFASKLVLRDVTSYNSAGIGTNVDIDATDVSVAGSPPGGCGFGGSLQGGKLRASNVQANYVSGTRLKARNLTVDADCAQGIRIDGKATLIGSSITGAQQVDVLTAKRPHLAHTTCGTSAQLLADGSVGPTWGVCAGD